MKKSIFLLGLLAISGICLTACGSKNYEMSFDEALEISTHSALQDVLAGNDNFEQNFNIAGNYDSDWNKVDANISSTSKQSLTNKNSESSTTFNADITSAEANAKINWALDIKLVDDAIYLNISSFELTWSDDLAMIAMMAEGFKNQWFSIPMTGLSDMPSTFSILKDSKELNSKTKEIVINEGSMVYNWKFTQFNGYNAWKFSLDNAKLNALIKEYYDSLNLNGEESTEIPELDIQNFEWYLVITWKDKVTTVIENMEMKNDDATIHVKWFSGEDFEITMSGTSEEEEVISITAQKKNSKYEISATIPDEAQLNWTISPKLSKSAIDLDFDAKLTVKAENEWEPDIVIPFNGSWHYKAISDFTVSAPENAQDLTELLWAYLWGTMWWDDYYYDEDYNYLDDEEYNEEIENIDAEDAEVEVESNTEIENNESETAE